MTLSLRCTAWTVPTFSDHGLRVGTSWGPIAVDAIGRKFLLENVGRYIRIHPDDLPRLHELGLALVGNRLVEAPASPAASGAAKADPDPPFPGDPPMLERALSPLEEDTRDDRPRGRAKKR